MKYEKKPVWPTTTDFKEILNRDSTRVKPVRPMNSNIRETRGGGKYGADRKDGKHAGMDYFAGDGHPVFAILDGVVERASFKPRKEGINSTYGNVIVLYHGEDARTGKHTYSLYAHLLEGSFPALYSGKKVKRGQQIAKTGNTGTWQKHYYNNNKKYPIRENKDDKGIKRSRESKGNHLHFEVKQSPKKIEWHIAGFDMGIEYGQYKVDPKQFLEKCFIKNLEPLTDAESAIVHGMVEIDFKTGPHPTFFVKAPEFKEIMNKIRPGTDIAGIKPPIFNLEFQNFFSRRFKDQYPSIALNVNGKTVDRIRTGIKNYDLRIWH